MEENFKAFDQLRQMGYLIGEMIWNFADFATPQGKCYFYFPLTSLHASFSAWTILFPPTNVDVEEGHFAIHF